MNKKESHCCECGEIAPAKIDRGQQKAEVNNLGFRFIALI
jgi:hypothetical protein